jgi:Flp pilus assembly protein TadD
MAAFAFAAAIDWVWELTVLPVAFLGLASAALAPDSRQPDAEFENRGFSGSQRFLWTCVSAVAILLIAVPMLGTQALDSSQRLVREGNLKGALADAERASELQPWAASPRIQEAQVQALLGRSQEGARLARQAIEKETENWRNWLVLSQLLAVRSPDLARAALKRALQLNPRSPYLRGQVRQSASNP